MLSIEVNRVLFILDSWKNVPNVIGVMTEEVESGAKLLWITDM